MSEIQDLSHAHQWTHDGDEVLIVKCVAADGSSHGGFKWPLQVGATVEPESWNPAPTCGEGLHGWPWGLSIGDGKDPDWQGKWLVFGAKREDVVSLGGKCKARAGVIRYVGNWWAATGFVLAGQMALVHATASGSASSTGERGSASSTGERGSASSTGWRGSASSTGASGSASSTGERGSASSTGESGSASSTGWSGSASSTGWSGSASSTGERGSASSTGASGSASSTGWSGSASSTGWRGSASSTGESGSASSTGACSAAVVTAFDGKARGGPLGVIALAFHNPATQRSEMRAALIGDGIGKSKKLKPNVWYRLNEAGKFVECEGQQ